MNSEHSISHDSYSRAGIRGLDLVLRKVCGGIEIRTAFLASYITTYSPFPNSLYYTHYHYQNHNSTRCHHSATWIFYSCKPTQLTSSRARQLYQSCARPAQVSPRQLRNKHLQFLVHLLRSRRLHLRSLFVVRAANDLCGWVRSPIRVAQWTLDWTRTTANLAPIWSATRPDTEKLCLDGYIIFGGSCSLTNNYAISYNSIAPMCNPNQIMLRIGNAAHLAGRPVWMKRRFRKFSQRCEISCGKGSCTWKLESARPWPSWWHYWCIGQWTVWIR